MLSRTKLENIYGLVFNLVNLSLYLLAAAASIMKAVVEHSDVSQVLTCAYAFILSLALVFMEAKSYSVAIHYFRFFTLYRGRAILVMLLGAIILGSTAHPFLLISGILNIAFGFMYVLVSFIPDAPIPRPISENWQNWKEYSAEGLDLERPTKDANTLDNASRLKMSMLEKPQHGSVSPV